MNNNNAKVFFTADLHIGHSNIIDHCDRPYKSVDEMNDDLVRKWNNKVSPRDTVYVLGDFSYVDVNPWLDILNGAQKFLIIGNHDRPRKTDKWSYVYQYLERTIEDTRLIMFHYPIAEWNGFYRGTNHLFGHCHGRGPTSNKSCDVGVDVFDFEPVTLTEIKAKMATYSE